MTMETNFYFDSDREAYIKHYGIPGMKWGVRNAETLRKYGMSGAKKIRSKATGIQESHRIRAKRSKVVANRSKLSNKDLDRMISRLEKEQKLKKLANSEVHPIRSAVKKTLGKSGGVVLTAALTGATVMALSGAVNTASAKNVISGDLATAMVSSMRKKI